MILYCGKLIHAIFRTIRPSKGFSTAEKASKNHVTCAFDSFLTIWLCTLPEKFKQWYEYKDLQIVSKQVASTPITDLNQEPTFPWYSLERHNTRLSPIHCWVGIPTFQKAGICWNVLSTI